MAMGKKQEQEEVIRIWAALSLRGKPVARKAVIRLDNLPQQDVFRLFARSKVIYAPIPSSSDEYESSLSLVIPQNSKHGYLSLRLELRHGNKHYLRFTVNKRAVAWYKEKEYRFLIFILEFSPSNPLRGIIKVVPVAECIILDVYKKLKEIQVPPYFLKQIETIARGELIRQSYLDSSPRILTF